MSLRKGKSSMRWIMWCAISFLSHMDAKTTCFGWKYFVFAFEQRMNVWICCDSSRMSKIGRESGIVLYVSPYVLRKCMWWFAPLFDPIKLPLFVYRGLKRVILTWTNLKTEAQTGWEWKSLSSTGGLWMVFMFAVRLRGKTDKHAAETNSPAGLLSGFVAFLPICPTWTPLHLSPVFNNADGLRRRGAGRSSGTDAFLTWLCWIVFVCLFFFYPHFQSQLLEMGKNLGFSLHRWHQRLANVSRDCFNPPPGAVDTLFI